MVHRGEGLARLDGIETVREVYGGSSSLQGGPGPGEESAPGPGRLCDREVGEGDGRPARAHNVEWGWREGDDIGARVGEHREVRHADGIGRDDDRDRGLTVEVADANGPVAGGEWTNREDSRELHVQGVRDVGGQDRYGRRIRRH